MTSDKQGIKLVTGEGKKNLPVREKIASIVILVVLSLLFLQVGYQWVNSWLYFRRVQIAVAEQGSIDLTMNVRGLITRHEKVVNSSHTGVILGKIPEGDRVSVGGEVMTIFPDYEDPKASVEEEDINFIIYYYDLVKDWLRSMFYLEGDFDKDETGEVNIHISKKGDSISVKSPQAGIVSYEIDGLEDSYLPGYPYDLLQKNRDPDDGLIEVESTIKSDFVNEGDPLFKIVDNWEWFISIVVDSEIAKSLENRKNIKITVSFLPDEIINAYMVDIQRERDLDLVFITYRIGRQVPGFSRHRWVDAELNYNTHEGIMVPRSAVIELDGAEGVYLNERGRVVFYPLEIIHEEDGKLIVDGISSDSIIIIRPDLVSDGQRLE